MSFKKSSTTTTVTKNSYTCVDTADQKTVFAQVQTVQLNNHSPDVEFSITPQGRKRPTLLCLTREEFGSLADMFAQVSKDLDTPS